MANPINFGIRVSVDGQAAVPELERIGTAGVKMAGQIEQAGQAMESAFNNGAAAVSKTSQAVSSLGETEEQAAERIRAMVAASMQQVNATNEVAQAYDRAQTASRRTAEENASLAESLARVTAQMSQARSSSSTVTTDISSQQSKDYVAALQRQFDMLGKNSAELAAYEVRIQGGTKALQAKAAALAQNTQALKEEIAAEERNFQAGEAFLTKLREQTAVIGMNKTQLLEHKAAQLGVAEAAAPMIAKLGEAGEGAHKLNFATAGAKRELLVLAHELSQGNYQRFGGSMMVLGEQTGAAGLLFSATGLAAIGLAAAVVGVGYAMIKGAAEQKHMDDALIMTGNYAGATSDKLNDLAHQAVATGGSIGEAKKIVTELAASGKFTVDMIGTITDATVAWEHATGQSAKSIIKEFETLAVQTSSSSGRSTEAVSRAALKLDDTYHFLTEAVYEQIRALEKEGDTKAASALATENFARVTKERSEQVIENLGKVAKAWNTVKEVAGAAVDALNQAGAKPTPATDVQKATRKLQLFDDGLADSNQRLGRAPDAMSADLAAARLKIVKELTDAVVKLNAADAAANAQGAARIAESEANHAAARVAEDDRKLQRKGMSEMQVQLEQYRSDIEKIKAVNPDSILVTPEAIAAHEAAIVKAHTAQVRGNDDRAKLLQDALLVEQTALERQKIIFDQREKMLALYHSKMGLSDADFYAGREAARNEYIAAEESAFNREASLIQNSKATTPQEIAARKEKYDALLKQHLSFVDSMRAQRTDDAANELADVKKQNDDVIKAILNAGATEAKRLDDAILKQRQHNAEIGKTKAQIDLVRQSTEDLDTAQLVADANYLRSVIARGGYDAEAEAAFRIRLNNLESEIEKRKTLSGLLATGAQLDGAAAAKKELDKLFDPTKAQSFGEALRGAIGGAGDSMSKLVSALEAYSVKQAQMDKARAEASVAYANDAQGMAAVSTQIADREMRNRLGAYANMTGAAKGFFSEQSKGYKALQAAEQTFRAFELALAISTMATKSGLVAAFTSLFVAGKATETAATVASVAPDVAASMAKGSAAAVAGVAAQAAGDPYTAFPRMAMMAALMAALGFAVAGARGSGVDIAKQRQEAAGTGTVLGDSSAKSDSIARSLAEVSKNSSLELSNTAGMLRSLQNIESSISGLGNLVARQLNITNPVTSSALGFERSNVGSAINAVIGDNSVTTKLLAKIPVVGEILSGLTSTIGNFISKGFGTKTSLVDSGIYAGSQSLSSIQTSGLAASAYADIEKTKKFLFVSYSKSTETELSALGADVQQQLSLVINNLAAGAKAATGLLGISSDQFTDQMKGFVVDLGKISLKGLTGEQIQKQLEAVFSSLGDKMAMSALSGLESFQKVGEGYFETLSRVATDYANVDSILSSVGLSFGSVGTASIAARERLIEMAGGIDSLSQMTSNYAKDFLTDAERLAPVRKYVTEQMSAIGQASVTTREQFKAVVDQLVNSGRLATEAGAQEYAQLMKVASAFAQVYPALESTATAARSAADILDERKDLQKQIDALTMTSTQLRQKERAAIDSSNLALFDRITALQNEANAYKEASDNASTAMGGLTKSVNAEKERINAAYTAQVDAIKKVAEVQKTAAQEMLTAAESKVSSLKTVVDSLGQALNNTVVESAELAQQRRVAAQGVLNQALSASNVGASLADYPGLSDAINALSNPSMDMYSSFEEYALDQAKTANVLQQLQGNAKNQQNYAQQTVDRLNATIKAIDDDSQAQLAALDTKHKADLAAQDSILSNAQQQLDTLKGINTAVLSVRDAMTVFNSALAALRATPTGQANVATANVEGLYNSLLGRPSDSGGSQFYVNAIKNGASVNSVATNIVSSPEFAAAHSTGSVADNIESLYQTILGRHSEQAGLEFWINAANNGQSISQIAAQFTQSDEYKKLHKFDVGTNYVPGDMPAYIHEGERIIPAADNRSLMTRLDKAAGNDFAMSGTIDRLNSNIEQLWRANERTAAETKRTADILDLISGGGRMPILVEIDS